MREKLTDIFLGIIFFVLVVFTYFQNYKYNDNSKDWLNHDYSLGLIKSVTTNTVLMTEGGDNQVFGLAYFQMAEFKRPDVVCYDQKGNVFKRIYGDLRYLPFQNLQLRMDIVDYNIVNGAEPFYRSELGTRGEPEFEEYKLKGVFTKKNVYMTWTGKELWKYGDYYYKQYGMMYRVSDSKYFIVDKLKKYRSLPLDYLKKEYRAILVPQINPNNLFDLVKVMEYYGYVGIVSNKIFAKKEFRYTGGIDGKLLYNELAKRVIYENAINGISIDLPSFNGLISQINNSVDKVFDKVFNQVLNILSKEGYIKVVGNRAYFVKDYDHPNGLDTMDYYAYYKKRWEETPVSLWWDYLTREIATSFNYSLAKYYFDEIYEYKKVMNVVEPQVKNELVEKIKNYEKEIPVYLDEAVKYGWDMSPIIFNSAMLYYQMYKYYIDEGNRDIAIKDFQKARELIKKAIDVDMFATYAFIRYGLLNIEYVNNFADPQEESRYLDEIKYYMDLAIKNLSYRKEYKGDPKNAREYNDLNAIKSIADRYKSVPKSQIVSLEESFKMQSDTRVKADIAWQLAIAYLQRFAGIDPSMIDKSKVYINEYINLSKNKDANFYRNLVNYFFNIRDLANLYKYSIEAIKNTKDDYFYFIVGFAADNLGKYEEALSYYSQFVNTSRMYSSQEYKHALDRIEQIKKILRR
ncbi:MAG: hypothetical protein ACP5KI_02020 [Brevinematia bacterium]